MHRVLLPPVLPPCWRGRLPARGQQGRGDSALRAADRSSAILGCGHPQPAATPRPLPLPSHPSIPVPLLPGSAPFSRAQPCPVLPTGPIGSALWSRLRLHQLRLPGSACAGSFPSLPRSSLSLSLGAGLARRAAMAGGDGQVGPAACLGQGGHRGPLVQAPRGSPSPLSGAALRRGVPAAGCWGAAALEGGRVLVGNRGCPQKVFPSSGPGGVPPAPGKGGGVGTVLNERGRWGGCTPWRVGLGRLAAAAGM